MTSTGPGDGQGSNGRPEEGPFILRPLLDNVPLVTDETEGEVKINCVEYYGRPHRMQPLHEPKLIDSPKQIATYMSAPARPSYSISYRYLPTQKIPAARQYIF